MSGIQQAIGSIESIGDHSARVTKYQELTLKLFQEKDFAGAKTLFTHCKCLPKFELTLKIIYIEFSCD
jgi:hypothetical protein